MAFSPNAGVSEFCVFVCVCCVCCVCVCLSLSLSLCVVVFVVFVFFVLYCGRLYGFTALGFCFESHNGDVEFCVFVTSVLIYLP